MIRKPTTLILASLMLSFTLSGSLGLPLGPSCQELGPNGYPVVSIDEEKFVDQARNGLTTLPGYPESGAFTLTDVRPEITLTEFHAEGAKTISTDEVGIVHFEGRDVLNRLVVVAGSTGDLSITIFDQNKWHGLSLISDSCYEAERLDDGRFLGDYTMGAAAAEPEVPQPPTLSIPTQTNTIIGGDVECFGYGPGTAGCYLENGNLPTFLRRSDDVDFNFRMSGDSSYCEAKGEVDDANEKNWATDYYQVYAVTRAIFDESGTIVNLGGLGVTGECHFDDEYYNESYTDVDDILNNFKAKDSAKGTTIRHLYSGRDFAGSTIGYATCSGNHGISQQLWSNTVQYRAYLMAHELGHNFDGSHEKWLCGKSSGSHGHADTVTAGSTVRYTTMWSSIKTATGLGRFSDGTVNDDSSRNNVARINNEARDKL